LAWATPLFRRPGAGTGTALSREGVQSRRSLDDRMGFVDARLVQRRYLIALFDDVPSLDGRLDLPLKGTVSSFVSGLQRKREAFVYKIADLRDVWIGNAQPRTWTLLREVNGHEVF
jgi:hypothetical protein